MNPIFDQIDELKAKWSAAQPLPEAKYAELWRKFRLEWNYNSNHIEGNTLTYGETELLLIMGQTKGDHTIREYDEMKAHDTAVAKLTEMANSGDILRETDIRDFNKLILKEPYWAEAVTDSGQTTPVEIIPGEYKRFPNNVKSPTGEAILFASPTDTPIQVAELVKWMREELQAPTLHPLACAAALHHRFLKIHPFADGNGRVARLVANFVLLRAGFPPLIVKSKDKAAYIAALRVADVGEPEQLTLYFTQRMFWSLDIALRAARGESIEEPDDLDKEMSIFVQGVGTLPESKPLSAETLQWTYEHSFQRLFAAFETRIRQLESLFVQVHSYFDPPPHGKIKFPDYWNDMFSKCDESARQRGASSSYGCAVCFALRGIKSVIGKEKSFTASIGFGFQEFTYKIFVTTSPNQATIVHTSSYGHILTAEEINEITTNAIKPTFDAIRKASEQGS